MSRGTTFTWATIFIPKGVRLERFRWKSRMRRNNKDLWVIAFSKRISGVFTHWWFVYCGVLYYVRKEDVKVCGKEETAYSIPEHLKRHCWGEYAPKRDE